jgi:hypothetical protein
MIKALNKRFRLLVAQSTKNSKIDAHGPLHNDGSTPRLNTLDNQRNDAVSSFYKCSSSSQSGVCTWWP